MKMITTIPTKETLELRIITLKERQEELRKNWLEIDVIINNIQNHIAQIDKATQRKGKA